jgi:hypothetical protein
MKFISSNDCIEPLVINTKTPVIMVAIPTTAEIFSLNAILDIATMNEIEIAIKDKLTAELFFQRSKVLY